HVTGVQTCALPICFREVEVKQRLWVDPLEGAPVSCPHSMRYFMLALLACVAAVACGNPLGLPAAFISNVVDTVSLYALSGTPVSLPSGYSIISRHTVRTDQGS